LAASAPLGSDPADRNKVAFDSVVGKVVYSFKLTVKGDVYPFTPLAPFTDPDSKEYRALLAATYPALCGSAKMTSSCVVRLGDPDLTNYGYEFPVAVSTVWTGIWMAPMFLDSALDEQLAVLVVGTDAKEASFLPASGLMCEFSMAGYIKVSESLEFPISPAVQLALPGATIEKGLPDTDVGLPSGAPCTADLQCASGSCPSDCKGDHKPWMGRGLSRSADTLAPVRTLLFGIGVCTRMCA